jgi:hypothetical protein
VSSCPFSRAETRSSTIGQVAGTLRGPALGLREVTGSCARRRTLISGMEVSCLEFPQNRGSCHPAPVQFRPTSVVTSAYFQTCHQAYDHVVLPRSASCASSPRSRSGRQVMLPLLVHSQRPAAIRHGPAVLSLPQARVVILVKPWGVSQVL